MMSHPPKIAERVVVAMSGGVDSSVVAALLTEQGYDAIGISMRLYKTGPSGPPRGCCSPDDLFDARAVAATLGIPFYVVNYEAEFERRVIAHFVDEYRRGRTPSPCILCNDHLKFDTLLERTFQLGAKRLATGHYARIERDESGAFHLKRGRDPVKDQSYFLFGIRRDALPRLLFPLGGLTKDEVRSLAERFGLPTAAKAESQDLCFVGDGHYLDFLEKQIPESDRRPGEIVDVESGRVLGAHDGIHRYTIGQRRGLGVSGDEPLYVVGISGETGRISVGPKRALGSNGCTVDRCNWLGVANPESTFRARVQIRYRHQPVGASVEPLSDERARVHFDAPEPAVTPGQAAVFYKNDEVLGGGWIESQR